MLGVAYKSDIADWRESPAVKLIELLRNAGAIVAYHDPHVPSFATDGIALDVGAARAGRLRRRRDRDGALRASTTRSSSTDAQLVVDLRNATGRAGVTSEKVWKL